MTTLRLFAAVFVLTVCAVALLPFSSLGLVYAVLTACILLALLPVSVETLMAVEIEGGNEI